ncbi:hypothetical protein MCUN1_001477 [Malassezia cuniculi]|uniref:Nuclear rim protein 1 n=1 Tax=Malassezia cuniculi TaxID=948313 RepID=A0AAF0JAT7_9BASI|nr:hypothetical protein MCUN1_001477 [Malassezia cuniculi]
MQHSPWDTPPKRHVVAARPPRTPLTHIQGASHQSHSPAFRRSAAFSSPSIRARTPPPEHSKQEAPTAKWAPKIAIDTGTLISYVQSWQMALEELIQQPELGVPIAVGLHVASLVAQILLPGSPFAIPFVSSSYVPPSQRRGQSKLFATRPHAEHGYGAVLGRTLAVQRSAALRAVSVSLLTLLVFIALLNAYTLFMRRRTYRLWYRDESHAMKNPHARLEAPPQDQGEPRTWRMWGISILLAAARQVPVLEWFVPPAPVKPAPKERLYTLRVWDIRQVQITIFAVMNVGAFGAWVVTPVLMAVFSLQAHLVSHEYAAYVKDQSTLAAEMLHEYDEKFVLPRAMPMVRDASTMTDDAPPLPQGYF